MKVLSIIAAAFSLIGIGVSAALAELAVTDTYVTCLLICAGIFFFFLTFSVFAIIHSFIRK